MILERIRQVYPELTRSQKRIADFVVSSYQEVAFMTASRMARRLGLNEATVVRFAQRLGYPGYPELINDVQSLIQIELQGDTEIETTDAAEALSALLADEITGLRRLMSHISPELAQRATAMLCAADQIYVLGHGLSTQLAQLLALNLQMLGLRVMSPSSDPLSMAAALASTDERTVVVAISFLQRCPQLARALEYAKERGAETLAIAESPVSPCAQAADAALICPARGELALPSLTPAGLLIDLLIHAIARETSRSASPALDRAYDIRDLLLS
ncbi:MAG: MurR/RpiR family transcriptional regulator [Anaerolineae bacterium]|nr:MurR/RpiR family transcriptional regulator [Anaerolineae bacterium]